MIGKAKIPAATDALPEDELDLVALTGMILREWRWLLVGVISALAAAVIYLAATPPTYRADALLQLERQNTSALPSNFGDLFGQASSNAPAEMQILSSRSLLATAVSELHLDWSVRGVPAPVVGPVLARHDILPRGLWPAYARRGDAMVLGLLQVPPEWLDRTFSVTLGEGGALSVTLPDGQTVTGQVGATIERREQGFALRVDQVTADPGRVFRLSQVSERVAVGRIAGGLSAEEVGRQTGILEITYDAPDPVFAEQVLQAVLDAYIGQGIRKGAAAAQKSLDFMESQIPQAEATLRKAEEALNDYRNRSGAVDVSIETQTLLGESAALENTLRELEVEGKDLSERYTPAHPMMRQYMDRRNALEKRQAELQKEIGGLPDTQQKIANLTRDLSIAQETYVQMQTRIQELRVARASEIGNARIVDRAQAGLSPVAPRSRIILLGAALIGLMVAIVVLLIRKALRRGVEDATQLEDMGLSVFATLPQSALMARAPKRGPLPLLAKERPDDMVVESLRGLRTSLHFALLDAKTRSIALSSPSPGQGKSFVSANLAVVCAQAGQKVCLIDADMRRGTLRRYMGGARGRRGLAEVLSGQAEWRDALVDGPVTGLKFLDMGTAPPNPSELLMRDRFAETIAQMGEEFDLLIIDTPPILAVTDAVIVGRAVGAMIGVVRHLTTELGAVMSMAKALEVANVHLAGTVLNGFDPAKATYRPGGYQYNYYYSYRRNPYSQASQADKAGQAQD